MDYITYLQELFENFWWGSHENFLSWCDVQRANLSALPTPWDWPTNFLANLPTLWVIFLSFFLALVLALVLYFFFCFARAIEKEGDSASSAFGGGSFGKRKRRK